MRRFLLPLVLAAGLVLVACNPVPQDELARWKYDLSHVTPASSPPPVIRSLLNTGIRAGIPVFCPALASQAEPAFRPFITATCDSIVASNDPFTTLTGMLPMLCAGDPPIGTQVYPKLSFALIHGCPLLMKLIPLLGLLDYVPGMDAGTG